MMRMKSYDMHDSLINAFFTPVIQSRMQVGKDAPCL